MNFTCIVAADINNGIGKNGQLPWPRLPADMAFFKKMTVGETKDSNAIIMGRKTWDSIPAKFRPLPDRINIVLSKTLTLTPETFSTKLYICRKGLDEAVTLADELFSLDKDSRKRELFVGGGGEVYKEALSDPRCTRVLLTRVGKTFEADVFLPSLTEDFKLANVLGQGEHEGTTYSFGEWIRK